jgi:Homeodomain-like domain
VLKDFNERGSAALRPSRSPGRLRRIDTHTREQIVAVALSRPHDLGLLFTRWSLPKLRNHLIEAAQAGCDGARGLLRSSLPEGASRRSVERCRCSPGERRASRRRSNLGKTGYC